MMREGTIPVLNVKKSAPDEIDENVQASWQSVQDEHEKLSLNPIIGMHRTPRKTLETIYRVEYPMLWPVLLMAAAGISHSLNQFISQVSYSYSNLLESIAVGALSGIVVGLLLSFLIVYIGRMFGGTAGYRKLFIAWGWSCAPSAFLLIIWAFRFALVGPEFFSNEPVNSTSGGLLDRGLIYLTLASVVFMIWQMVLTVIAVSTAHEFRKLYAIGTLIIVFSVIAGGLIGIGL